MPPVYTRAPESDLSVYFDARDNTMSPTQENSISMPAPVNLYDNGPVSEEPTPALGPLQPKPSVIQHPNGSEGWLPTEDTSTNSSQGQNLPQPNVGHQRVASVQPSTIDSEDLPIQTNGAYSSGDALLANTAANSGSVNEMPKKSLGRSSSRRSDYTTADGRTMTGSAFVNGAGATGPMATVEEDSALHERAVEAHDNLTPKQKAKIAKAESKNGKRLSKIIKSEGKTEKQSLTIMIKELEDLQKIQRNAVKSEAHVQGNHSKLLTVFKKKEALYLNAKRNYERAAAELNAEGETLEAVRANARDATARMQDKAAEVDSLRKTLAVDDREREVKLAQLNGDSVSKRGGFWKD